MYGKDTIVHVYSILEKLDSVNLYFCMVLNLYFSERKTWSNRHFMFVKLHHFYHLILFLSVVLAESCANDKLGCHTDEIIVHIT